MTKYNYCSIGTYVCTANTLGQKKICAGFKRVEDTCEYFEQTNKPFGLCHNDSMKKHVYQNGVNLIQPMKRAQ